MDFDRDISVSQRTLQRNELGKIPTEAQAAEAAAQNELPDTKRIVKMIIDTVSSQGELYGIEVELTGIKSNSPAIRTVIDYLKSDRGCIVDKSISPRGQVLLKIFKAPLASDDPRDNMSVNPTY